MNKSYFTGGLLGFVWNQLLVMLITMFTLGVGLPWAITLQQRWETKHTYIDGRQLKFTGSGFGLFGRWLRLFFLTIITLGIYSFWAWIDVKKWIAENTTFEPITND